MSAELEVYPTSSMIETGYSHYIIFALAILSIGWGSYNSMLVSRTLHAPTFLRAEASVRTSWEQKGPTRLFA